MLASWQLKFTKYNFFVKEEILQEGILKKIKDLDICMIRKMSELKNCAGHNLSLIHI